MIDVGEVATDVAMKNVLMTATELCKFTEGGMGAMADSVCERVGIEGGFKDGIDDFEKGMMDYSVSIGCGRNESWFGFVNVEGCGSSGLIGSGSEFVLKLENFTFKVVVKGKYGVAKSFRTLCFFSSGDEVFKADNFGVEIAFASHGIKDIFVILGYDVIRSFGINKKF